MVCTKLFLLVYTRLRFLFNDSTSHAKDKKNVLSEQVAET